MEQTRENMTKPAQGAAPGDRQEFETLLKDYDVALLTTHGTDGHFHTRPMALSKKRRSGTVEIIRGRNVIHALWEADWKPWFPKGPDEGDIALPRFIPEPAQKKELDLHH